MATTERPARTGGIDKESLRRRYAEERDKRLRPDGNDQYVRITGEFGHYVDDPHTPRTDRDDLWQLAEDLLTHDELAGLWRARHVQMVERQIGTKSGTGGSTGAPYLHKRVPMRYYPLLWELRDWL